MEFKQFKKLLKIGNKAENKLSSSCADMAIFFEPYFDCEIEVLYQMGDGFVILYNMHRNDNQANLNEPVTTAFENIKKDENYYR